jgi:hypothetical protein
MIVEALLNPRRSLAIGQRDRPNAQMHAAKAYMLDPTPPQFGQQTDPQGTECLVPHAPAATIIPVGRNMDRANLSRESRPIFIVELITFIILRDKKRSALVGNPGK